MRMQMAMSICTGLKPQAGDGMGEKKERGRFTLRFNEGDPIHEAAIGLLELQSPRTKAQYVANAVVYYNEHFGQGAAATKCFYYQQRSGSGYRQRDFAAGRYGTGKSKRAGDHSQIG